MLKLLISAFILVHVHGAVFPFVCGVGRIHFVGQRVGDVTEAGLVSAQQRSEFDDRKIYEIFLNVEIIGRS